MKALITLLRLTALAVLPTLPLLGGCETFVESEDCDTSAAGNPDIVYDGGVPNSPCFYASSANGPSGTPFDGEYLLFNGGMHYELEHHLACAPSMKFAYLSFEEFGELNGGQEAQAAGNQDLFLGSDATSIRIANDSCSDYWLLVTATVDPSTCDACK